MNNTKVVWVTGASTGIGKEIAMQFSKAGYIVVVTARRKSRLVSIVKEIKFAGREAMAFVCNVASERSVNSTAKRIIENFGRIDCLVNNAGVTAFKSFLDTKVFDYDYIMNINLRGSFLTMKSVMKPMIKNKRGHIININSVSANTVYFDSSVYSASKAGLLALSNCVRKEVRKFNIKVTNIFPGATETAMWDAKTRQKNRNRMMSPEDIAKITLQTFEQPKKVLIEDIVIRPLKGDL
ncbi:MAG: SDR family oxidoreductase [Ignavibacteria bacterium]